MIRVLCEKQNIRIVKIRRRIGQIPQKLIKAEARTVSAEELIIITKEMDVRYEQVFGLANREKIEINNG